MGRVPKASGSRDSPGAARRPARGLGALVWLLSEDCQGYAEWIGDDYNRIQRAAILISDQLIAAREKVTE